MPIKLLSNGRLSLVTFSAGLHVEGRFSGFSFEDETGGETEPFDISNLSLGVLFERTVEQELDLHVVVFLVEGARKACEHIQKSFLLVVHFQIHAFEGDKGPDVEHFGTAVHVRLFEHHHFFRFHRLLLLRLILLLFIIICLFTYLIIWFIYLFININWA